MTVSTVQGTEPDSDDIRTIVFPVPVRVIVPPPPPVITPPIRTLSSKLSPRVIT